MKRIFNTPLKLLAVLTLILGLLGIFSFSYFSFLGIYLVGIALFLFLIDYLIIKFLKKKKYLWIAQSTLSFTYVIISFLSYMKWQEHNYLIFPNGFKGQAGIIFGMEGYPELPKTIFWKKTIHIPQDGIIITSTKIEDVPDAIQYVYADHSAIKYQDINWDPNFAIDCIVTDNKIKSWLFKINKNSSTVKEKMVSLCNEIAKNRKSSLYKSKNSVVWSDDKGKYLWLQNKNLTSLPEGLGKLSLYKVILTGNSFNDIPRQIYEISSLEELIFAVNPIHVFPCDLSRLKRLKSISFAETGIKEINCDLSSLDSIAHFDISRNGLTKFPEQIKSIPNLSWISLQNNQFKDISFIDSRLKNLETLYLYSNKIKSISEETKFLGNLKELLIFNNEIESIPANIADLKNLEKLEIWDNPIKSISPKIAGLIKLKSMRIDDDFLTQTDKDNLKKWLPNCEINYQTRSEKKRKIN